MIGHGKAIGDGVTPRVVEYEVEPYRSAWVVRQRGSRHELLCTTRGEAMQRAEALRGGDASATVVLRDRGR
jgi:hypothetical protein